jgi:hypothetical protein
MHVSGCLHMQVRCVCRIRHVNAATAAWRRQNAETVAALSAHPDMGAVLRGTMAGAMLDWEGAPYPWWTVDGGHRDNCRQGKTPAGRSSTSAQAQEKGEAFLLTQANKAEVRHEVQAETWRKMSARRSGCRVPVRGRYAC